MGLRGWLNKVTGVTQAKRQFARATGVPTTRSGFRRKFFPRNPALGCVGSVLAMVLLSGMAVVAMCGVFGAMLGVVRPTQVTATGESPSRQNSGPTSRSTSANTSARPTELTDPPATLTHSRATSPQPTPTGQSRPTTTGPTGSKPTGQKVTLMPEKNAPIPIATSPYVLGEVAKNPDTRERWEKAGAFRTLSEATVVEVLKRDAKFTKVRHAGEEWFVQTSSLPDEKK